MNGSSYDEVIWGDSKNNTDTSSNGADILNGGGGNGADIIAGDEGADTLYGDRGGDKFVYNWHHGDANGDSAAVNGAWSALSGDWIKDFNSVEGDKLDLSGFNGHLTGANAPSMLQWSGNGPSAWGVWVGAGPLAGDKIVYADLDGDKIADVAIRVTGNIGDKDILGTNHGPVAGNDVNSVLEDATVTGTVAGNDSDQDGNTLTYSIVGNAPVGLTLNTNGTYSFDADSYDALKAGETKDVVATTYQVADGKGGVATANLTIIITGVNDAPTGSAITLADGTEDTAKSFTVADLLAGWTDVDKDALSVKNVTVDHGTLSFDAGTYTFHPDANYNGPVTVSYQVSDGTADVSTTAGFNLAAVNDAPTGSAITLADGTEDTAKSFTVADLLAGWTDVDKDTLAVTNVTVDHGTLAYNPATSTYTFTPDANYNGPIVVSYKVSDGTASVDTKAGFSLAAVADPSVFGGTATGSVTEDSPVITATGALTVSDPNGPASFVAQSNVSGTYGSFSINAAGAWIYTLNNSLPATNALNDGQSPVEKFTVTSSDGTTTFVSVTVIGHTDVVWTTPAVFTGAGDPNDFDTAGPGPVAPGPVIVTDDPGNSTIIGSNAADMIMAGNGNDQVYGYAGNDEIWGQVGADNALWGQAGDDKLYGGQGADTIYGGSGNDVIYGFEPPASLEPNNDGGDLLFGGSGSDTIYGQTGADVIVGGFGADLLSGGGGADIFRYLSNKDTGDTITDFSQAQGDKIDFDAFNYGANAYLGAVSGGGAVGAGQFGWQQVGTNTLIYADTDGKAGADLVITLTGHVNLVAADFLI
ncbi:cadherin-like domain-containing protein [Sphingomonas sp. BN140010]|uniref:Cadherin-like domain-containing protein n=1 Tax=Sphingomonas arvum TaxID=2992113 RepID=A0ABT3JHI1_9SPHN|nr:cadherin-like domain-containing protein [Sphingomonas sp. BN140010]MCW3798494.1 cadherin-like domain-containing protein [Sphingomonas sp. BN140010]